MHRTVLGVAAGGSIALLATAWAWGQAAPGEAPADQQADRAAQAPGEAGPGAIENSTQIVIPPAPGYPWDPYLYDPYYPPYYPYYYRRPFYYPPAIIPPEWLYGPQAIRRFMGLPPVQIPAAPNVIIYRGSREEAEEKRALRGTGQRSVALGWKFIGYGDTHFRQQRYGQAYQRYKKAAEVAPQLADAYFRQGFALIATGGYELAAKAFKRGLELNPHWPRSGFRIDELFGGNAMAKTAQVNALAQAGLDQPHNGDLLFLVGIQLYFDGQKERAATFFRRATQLGAVDPDAIQPFLDAPDEGNPPAGP